MWLFEWQWQHDFRVAKTRKLKSCRVELSEKETINIDQRNLLTEEARQFLIKPERLKIGEYAVYSDRPTTRLTDYYRW
jgi:hypothetical protein